MRPGPAVIYEATSALAPHLSQSAISVMATYPAGQPWFIVFDRQQGEPLHETDRESEARDIADCYQQMADLHFAFQGLNSQSHELYLSAGSDVTLLQSGDGLPLLPDALVQGQVDLAIDQTSRSIDDDRMYPAISTLLTALKQINGKTSTKTQPQRQTLVFSFQAPAIIRDEEGPRLESQDVYIHAQITWGMDQMLSRIMLHVLDDGFEINKQPLWKLLAAVKSSPTHEIWYETPQEYDDWEIRTANYMPLFKELRRPDEHSARIYAYEGGAVLESAARVRPWMVEKDASGKPVPLRIVHAMEHEEFGEQGLRNDQQFMASLYLQDELTRAARGKVITQQSKQGIEMGQVVDGRQFSAVGRFDNNVVLEASFNSESPNVVGVRNWLNYRLWVEGELVLDVSPNNPALYEKRRASISPIRPLDTAAPLLALSDEQVGELLNLALIDPSELDGDDALDLPPRVLAFLQSMEADGLRSDARKLEEGGANLRNGVFTDVEDGSVDPSNDDLVLG